MIPWEGLSEEEKFEQLLFSRAATLLAEIADYKGDTEAAARELAPFNRVPTHLRSQRAQPARMFEYPSKKDLGWKLLRQELFVGWQLSVAEYRVGRVAESKKLLSASLHIAEAMQPRADGLLTQLYYGEAKLRMKVRDFLGATEMFRKSLVNASARFEKAGDEHPSEKEAAQYSIGKALGLGLAQCFLEQGRLEEARTVVVAGRLLLEQTPDLIHRYYARHLLGSIERSSARDSDLKLFESARGHLEACVAFFGREKPAVAFRSRYELGQISLLLGELDAAEAAMKVVIENVDSATTAPKWTANARIGLSRIARRRGEYALAIEEAHEARRIAQRHSLRAIEVKARTAYAQVLLEQHRDDPDGLEGAADELRSLLREVPEGEPQHRVFPLLVLARVHNARGDMRVAKRAFEAYERIAHIVQSARVREYASMVENEMFPPKKTFRCPADDEDPRFNLDLNVLATQRHVMQKVMRYYRTVNERVDALGVSKDTYHRLKNLIDERE